MEEAIRNKINALKAEVYELIKQQELLVLQNNQIQEVKLRKVQEIQSLESLHRDNPIIGIMDSGISVEGRYR